MNKSYRYLLILACLVVTLALSYALPRTQYKSPDFLSKLTIPAEMSSWRSRDVSGAFQAGDKRYFFINKIFARQYANDLGETLLFLVLDAGNFHHPKVCFGSSGYTVKPLEDITLEAAGHPFKAHVLHMEKGRESVLVIYWMTIDKHPVGWIGQKFIQFFYSMAHKQKIGLMGRLEVPVPTGDVQNALGLAQHFIRQISPGLPADQADYLFGKK
ncbi:MAG: exosortase C-terminal domain/associated protein EpsI [Candidatus Omnitrophota bacterium]